MATTQAKQRAVEKYNAKTYDRVYVRMKKADAQKMRDYVGDKSINAFINTAIMEKIDRDK